MEMSNFIIGFIVGASITALLCLILIKSSKQNENELKEQMKLYFEHTANKVLEESSSALTNSNKEKLEEFFKRFKDKIENFEQQARENFKTENENFTKFDMNIKSFIEAGNKISQDTSNLINVMKSDNKTSGKWGEIVLERILEASNLRRGEEFDIQKSTSEGRPDAVVYLPENRCIFIDSKTSFASWYDYVNAENATDKEQAMKQFVESTKSHISGLKKREYSNETASPSYVLMFIPIEGCYSMMFCNNNELWDYAWENNIMPVSPSTLLATLKIINEFHKVDKQNKNILEMAKLCANVHDKFCSLLAELLKTKDQLDSSIKKLNGKGNIINQLQKLEDLGAPVTKELKEIEESKFSEI